MVLGTLILLAYLLGSIPFGKLMGRRYGIDIQTVGSGNIGFANCLRYLGLGPALLVLAGDIAKGFLPVALAVSLLPARQVPLIGIVAILGHIYPIWLRGRGGKGIATGLGVLVALNPVLAIISALVWAIVYMPTRLNSLASLVMMACLPAVAALLVPDLLRLCLGMTIIITWAHRGNLVRLIRGQEKPLTARHAR